MDEVDQDISILTAFIAFCAFFISVALCISSIRSFCWNNDLSKCIKIITIIVFIMSCINGLYGFTTALIAYLESGRDLYNIFRIDIISFLFTIIFISLWLAIYILLLVRLHDTFKESIHKFPLRIFKVHIVNIILFLSLYIICIVTIYFNDSIPIHSEIWLAAYFILYLGGIIHLLYAFNQKLYKLIFLVKQTLYSDVVELNDRQIQLLGNIRKHAVLAVWIVICILSTMGQYAILVMVILREDNEETVVYETPNSLSGVWMISLQVLDLLVPLCIYLGYRANEKMYQRLCGKCDRICKVCCDCLAERKVGREMRAKMEAKKTRVTMNQRHPTIHSSLLMTKTLKGTQITVMTGMTGMTQNEIEM